MVALRPELGRRDPGRPPHRRRHRLCADRQHHHRLSAHGHRHAGERAGARHLLAAQHGGDRRCSSSPRSCSSSPASAATSPRSAAIRAPRWSPASSVDRILIGLFAISGMLTALAGALLELQPGGRLAGRAGRCAGAGDRGRDHRRGLAVGRAWHAGRHRRRRAGAGRAALRAHRHRRAAVRARHRHRRRAARRGAARCPELQRRLFAWRRERVQ